MDTNSWRKRQTRSRWVDLEQWAHSIIVFVLARRSYQNDAVSLILVERDNKDLVDEGYEYSLACFRKQQNQSFADERLHIKRSRNSVVANQSLVDRKTHVRMIETAKFERDWRKVGDYLISKRMTLCRLQHVHRRIWQKSSQNFLTFLVSSNIFICSFLYISAMRLGFDAR